MPLCLFFREPAPCCLQAEPEPRRQRHLERSDPGQGPSNLPPWPKPLSSGSRQNPARPRDLRVRGEKRQLSEPGKWATPSSSMLGTTSVCAPVMSCTNLTPVCIILLYRGLIPSLPSPALGGKDGRFPERSS
ncbi:unnamed protein product [Ectocarpus sp. 12 AP-2014]